MHDPLPNGFRSHGDQIINLETGATYVRDAGGQLRRTGTASSALRAALRAGVSPDELRTPAELDQLAAAYGVTLAEPLRAALLERTQRTEDLGLALAALKQMAELDTLADPRERTERREWLWGACQGLTSLPAWPYQLAQQLTGTVLDKEP